MSADQKNKIITLSEMAYLLAFIIENNLAASVQQSICDFPKVYIL
jgi:hypothetical protein